MNKKASRHEASRHLGLAVALVLGGCGASVPTAGPLDVVRAFGEVGASPGQFSKPRCIDSNGGAVWVIDMLARVQKLDAKTGDCVGGWRMEAWENGKPTGITVWTPPAGGKTRVFVADTHYHRVMIYDAAGLGPAGEMMDSRGVLLGKFGEYGEGDGQFIYPTDVAVLPTADGRGIRRLYVSEYGGNDRVNVFEPHAGEEHAFRFVFAFGRFGESAGTEPVEFNRPQAIELNAAGTELVVTDACNHRIGRFTTEGRLLGWVGTIGREPGQLMYPYGLEMLADGSALVAEFGGNRVQRIDLADGSSRGIYGEPGHGPGQVATPWGVTMIGELAYVLDTGNNRVQVIEIDGN